MSRRRLVFSSSFSVHTSAFTYEVDARVGVVGLPVEPVVLRGLDACEALALELARDGRAGEVPLAAGLRVEERVRARLRSEEHTSELQSRQYLVCRLLLEPKSPSS